jgi:hypothetical protein
MSKAVTHQPEPQADTLELINNEITASLMRQVNSGSSIDTKSVILVGYAGAASSFLTTRHGQPVLAVLAYLAYATAVGFGISAYAVRLYQDVPSPRRLLDGYITESKAETLAALAATRVMVFESNASKYDRKARRWLMSLISLAIGATAMLLALTSAYWLS